jgi:hypothetical protein
MQYRPIFILPLRIPFICVHLWLKYNNIQKHPFL